jgi:DNA mismatch repair protein MutL
MIAVLAPHVIDQIAAGEVIERPASVVKELVDNAIDAEARSIAVEIAAGGRALIRVSDDGSGMSPKDAVLALERHATSKLREVDDLWELSTMGFRGEALPSIASVSRMTLTTRRAGDDAATRVVIEAGRLVSVSDAGAPVGTTVEVADLLHNVPARLKFLKGEATEASHITELVSKVAMAYPRLHLRLRHNGRTALDTPPDRDGFARAQALLGPRTAARIVPVSGEESGVRITAYLGAPELAQATARGVQLFVGRRPVRDRGLLHALAMGYGELVPRGRHPFAIVLLDAPAGTVDINVHPQKLEVRFSDPAVVCAAVRHVVQAGVAAARWRDDAAGGSPVQLVGMVGMLPGVAPPLAPHGGAATPLAERHAEQMRSRQVSLGFEAAPEVRAFRGSVAAAPRDGASSPRDWARTLREQTRASRAAEEPAVYRPGGGEDVPRLPSLAEHVRRAMAVGDEPRGNPAGGAPDADGVRVGGAYAGEPRLEAWEAGGDRGPDPHVGAGLGRDVRVGGMHAGDSRPGAWGAGGDRGPDLHVGDGLGRGGACAEAPRLDAWEAGGDRGPDPHVGAGQGRDVRVGGMHAGDPRLEAWDAGGDRSPDPHVGAGQGRDARTGGTHAGGPPLADLGSDPRTGGAPEFGPATDSDEPLVDLPPLPHRLAGDTAPIAPHVGGFFSQLRYLGQLDLTYLTCEGDGELVLVDQHAAHERVELARLRERHARGGDARVAVQNMLFPVTLDATPAQLALVARVGELLAQVGFEVEPFGKATLALKAVPAGIRHGDPAHLLRRLLGEWAEVGAPSEAERLDTLLGTIACHSVVRAGDRLTSGEAETLLRSLDGVDLSLPAPHGRAVLLRLPLSEIGRRFGR